MTEREDILDDGSTDLRRGGGFSAGTEAAVRLAAKWGRYYLYALAASFLVSLLWQTVAAATTPYGAASLPASLFSVLFIVALIAYPTYQFYRFVTLTERDDLGEGIVSLAASIKYLGILTLVVVVGYLGLVVLGVAVAIGVSLFA